MKVLTKFKFKGTTLAIVEMNDGNTKTFAADYPRLAGHDAGSLRPVPRTYPAPTPKQPREWTRTRTGERLAQSLLAGVAVMSCRASYEWHPAVATTLAVSSAFFVGSILLGADNWSVFFRFIDRNKDGRVSMDDLRHAIAEVFGDDDEPEPEDTAPAHEPPPDIKLTDQSGTKSIPAPEPYIVRSLIIRAKTVDQPALTVEVDELCAFVRSAVACGKWTRRYWTSKERGRYELSQDTWQAYYHFFKRGDVGLWEIKAPRPTLMQALIDFRAWATSQPETNQPTRV